LITNPVLLGRNFNEYVRMFNLNEDLLSNKILDVASGVSSFCAEGNAKGYKITASDKIYNLKAEEIEERCKKDLDFMEKHLREKFKDSFNWNEFKSIDDWKKTRERTYKTFLEDYKVNKERYVYTIYPKTNFKDDEFYLSVVGHFLLLYDNIFDYKFHKETIDELLRVSEEIRIFPILNLRGERSIFLDKILNNYNARIEKSNYEFMRGGDKVLIIRR